MSSSNAEKNKAIVLEAFDTLFNKRDYVAAERFWSPQYIQHSAHIEPGRDGLFNLIKAAPPSLKYEPGVVLAEGDYVILHGRFSNIGLPVNWVAADVVRLKDGILVEHWTSFRTRPPNNSPRAGALCSATRFRSKHSGTPLGTINHIPRISRMKASIFFVIRARSGPRFCSRQIPLKNVMIKPARESLSSRAPRAAARLSMSS